MPNQTPVKPRTLTMDEKRMLYRVEQGVHPLDGQSPLAADVLRSLIHKGMIEIVSADDGGIFELTLLGVYRIQKMENKNVSQEIR